MSAEKLGKKGGSFKPSMDNLEKGGVEPSGNIKDLKDLAKEFSTGKMIPRKYLMLKLRLVELWTAKTITEPELKLLTSMLSREHRRGQIEDKFLEVFNRIEEATCTQKARCKTDTAPAVFYLLKDQVCSFRQEEQTNNEKFEKGSLFQYVVFVEKRIPAEFQMTKELLMKEERGHHADESMYPKEKILLHRLTLDDKWFELIFDIEEDLLSGEVETEEIYSF